MSSWKGMGVWLLAVLLLGGGGGVVADERRCPPAPAEVGVDVIRQQAMQARDRGFLWKISKDGRDSWLYGTLHVGRQNWIVPGPKVAAALESSDLLALELDLTDPATLETLQAFYKRGAGQIPAALRGRVVAQLGRVCMPETMLAEMNPLLLLTTIELLLGRETGLEAGYGTEFVLAGYARGAGKKIVALETVERQMSSLLPADGSIDTEQLEEALQHLEDESAATILNRIASTWADSDLAAMNDYASWCNCMETPRQRAEMKSMLDDRNVPLAQAIDALHAQGKSVFAAVGALHMVGSTGLPALLSGKGYSISKIEFGRRE